MAAGIVRAVIELQHESPLPFLPIHLDEGGEIFAVLDLEDHAWAMQWLWSIKWDRHRRKIYPYRTGYQLGIKCSIFLHKEVCLRANGWPPSRRRSIADHGNGQSLDCRRGNLRWATASENRLNIGGAYARQLRLQLVEERA